MSSPLPSNGMADSHCRINNEIIIGRDNAFRYSSASYLTCFSPVEGPEHVLFVKRRRLKTGVRARIVFFRKNRIVHRKRSIVRQRDVFEYINSQNPGRVFNVRVGLLCEALSYNNIKSWVKRIRVNVPE